MKTADEFYKEKFDVDIPNAKGVDMIKFAEEYVASLQPQPMTEDEIDKIALQYCADEDCDGWRESTSARLDFKAGFKAAITALQEKSKEQRGEEWISVKDRLPEVKEYGTPDLMVSDRVLCLTNTGLNAVGFLNNGVWIYDAKHNDFKRLGYSVTHWQPLPPPPKKQGDNGKE